MAQKQRVLLFWKNSLIPKTWPVLKFAIGIFAYLKYYYLYVYYFIPLNSSTSSYFTLTNNFTEPFLIKYTWLILSPYE